MSDVYNFPAHLAHRHVRKTNVGLSLAVATLSAGRRLQAAKDDAAALALSLDTAEVATEAGADAAIGAVNAAIDWLQDVRAGIGASRNRLDHAAASIATTIENAEAARSGLIDLGVAAAAADLAHRTLLNKVGLSMLDHASGRQKAHLRLVV